MSVSHAHPQPHDLPHVHTHVRAHTQGLLPSLPALTPQGTGNTHLVAPLSATDTHAKHSRFPTITVTPQAHIRTISYSHSVSLPPVIHLASPPANLLSHTRSLIPPYSQVQLSKHLHISHTHTHTQAQLPSTGLSTTPQLSPQQERGNPRDQSPPSVTRSVWSQRLSAEKNM